MSMHKEPLTELERQGLENHRLPIGTPSQLSDTFRIGMRWALAAVPVEPRQITEAMHVAACKVLTRASGLDGTPQRMLDAMLAAAPQPQRCPYCDDTGDVHSADGEWRGACACPAGASPQPTPPQQAAPKQTAKMGPAGVAFSDLFMEQFEALAGSVTSDIIKDAARLAAACAYSLAATPPQPTAPATQAQAVSQWLPIESAPKNGTEILVWWVHPTKDQPGVSLSHWLDNSKTATPWAGWALPKVIVPGMYVSHWMHKPGCPASAAQKEPT